MPLHPIDQNLPDEYSRSLELSSRQPRTVPLRRLYRACLRSHQPYWRLMIPWSRIERFRRPAAADSMTPRGIVVSSAPVRRLPPKEW